MYTITLLNILNRTTAVLATVWFLFMKIYYEYYQWKYKFCFNSKKKAC